MKSTVLLVVLCACATACGARHEVQVWAPPPLPSDLEGSFSDEPTIALVEALRVDDCERVVELSESLMDDLQAEASQIFHPPDRENIDPGEMRTFLSRYVQAPSPILEIGEHGFRFPRWLRDGYAYCLVEQGQLEAATSVYLIALCDGFDADLTWRLGLVSYWAGNPELALSILQKWPTDVDVPDGYREVLDLMRREANVPNCIQVRSGSID